jgi:RND family efflux transporter MFP subunit
MIKTYSNDTTFNLRLPLSLACIIFLLFFSLSSAEEQQAPIETITKPSADIELSFVQAGKILEITVHEGDQVKRGDTLARQEDEIELIQLQILTAKSNNITPIKRAQTELAQQQKYLEKMTTAVQDGAVTQWEMENAAFARDTARLSLKMAEFEHAQDRLQQQTIEEALRRLHLYSTLDGVVEEIRAEEGESVQALQTVIRIVNTDLIRIDVPVPVANAKNLAVQQKAKIIYANGEEIEGYIETISSVADAAANTLNVKVQASNSARRPAGERVSVSFIDPAQ